MSAPDRVIALGNLAGDLKVSLETAVRHAGLELLLTREPARAFLALERDGAIAVLVDMATLGAEQFCKRARGTDRLRGVPVIGMSRHPNELGFARVFAWGADDLVPLGATTALERRLSVLRDTQRAETNSFGQAVVAEATTQRRALVGRVLSQAGYDVKFAVDRGAVELYASQSETRLVVISAALGDPRRMIEAAARAGALPTWIVTAEARSVARLASSLSGLERVAVTSTSGSPEDVLFLANELVFGKGARRREWRALYSTPVAFRSMVSSSDEYGFSYDASPGGLYVRSLLPCETDEVEVELRLPALEERVRLYGRVARRFAFGSGSIASAPPGFSVKLEGPPEDLERWADACQKLIGAASDAFSNPPPAARGEGTPASANAEAALAVPPATLTIESVVAPLPTAMLEEVEKGTDVGELLAATLDEQTLAAVGTKPVTIDANTLDVREERPSEFSFPAADLLELAPESGGRPLEMLSSLAPDSGGGRLPLPAPAVASPEPPTERVKTPAAPVAVPLDWDGDAETEVRQSRPDTEPPQPAAPEPPQPPRPVEAPAWTPGRTQLLGTSVPRPAPSEPRRAPPSEPRRAPPPAPEPEPATTRSPTPVPPAEHVPVYDSLVPELSPSELVSEPAPAPAERAPPVPAAAPVPERAEEAARPQPARAFTPAPDPFAATLGLPAPFDASVPESPPAVARPAPEPVAEVPEAPAGVPARKSGSGLVLAAVGAVAIAGALVFFTSKRAENRAPVSISEVDQTAAPTAAPPTPASGAGTATAAEAAAPPLPAPADAPADPVAPEPTGLPSAAASAQTPAAAASAPPSAEATASAAGAVPSPGSETPKAAAAVPTAAAPPFEGKLLAERAALYVHSSATARVFVHGTDYGETNGWLVTSCGIRFVRLGRALGDFIEPGSSRVLKCGKQTELRIEPTP